MTDRTPGYTETLERVQRHLQDRIRTVVPAKVMTFYPGTAAQAPSVDVQPIPADRDRAGGIVPAPPVTSAPILYPGGGGWEITWPLAPGDDVMLFVADRAVDQWRRTGTPGEPRDGRRHAITDALVYPGAWPDTAPPTLSATEFTIRGPAGEAFVVTAAGLVNLGAKAPTDFVALAALVLAQLNDIRAKHDTHVHPHAMGPTGVPAVPMGTATSVAATKVKAL